MQAGGSDRSPGVRFMTSSVFRPNPLQYFLVPDVEVENGGEDEDEDLEEEEEEDDEGNVSRPRCTEFVTIKS